ncbi:hypothetical protein AGDE_07568 [Angomonas deanei]|nr:hypothetical protein AGDE_07568 [Angomonas deanei]|eukprot:EPY35139.1 hypothetical protein AGDE_07568 [Angomonas deanei]
MKICCYCGSTVHVSCSKVATKDQIIYKPANAGFENFLRVCYKCEGEKFTPRETPREKDNVRRAALRALTMKDELPADTYEAIKKIAAKAEKTPDSEDLMTELQNTVQTFFQPKKSLTFLKKASIASKAGGTGVVAAEDIPAYSIIGVYPGYPDALCGEQAKLGRPTSIYALMDLNCADYYNDVFIELQKTFTPFINEPNESERSNCAWIQEIHHVEGRLSVISIKEVKKGEELLIGYGPLYPRSYPFHYEAYAFHPVEGYEDPVCFALWYWPTKDEKDAKLGELRGILSR